MAFPQSYCLFTPQIAIGTIKMKEMWRTSILVASFRFIAQIQEIASQSTNVANKTSGTIPLCHWMFSLRRKRPSKSQLIAQASHKYREIRVGNGNAQIASMNK